MILPWRGEVKPVGSRLLDKGLGIIGAPALGAGHPRTVESDRKEHGVQDGVARHCRAIEACNQRGGRMLSIVDLIEAGTLGLGTAAYAWAAIGNGASFMVGALPGGAGKTTVMGALLNLVPGDVELDVADGFSTLDDGLKRAAARRCYICHEIGQGAYYAYLWGAALRRYFELPGAGHMLATNLHADTYEQARAQVCGTNGVLEDAFMRMDLIFFLSVSRVGGVPVRRVAEVWESDGRRPHRLVLELHRQDRSPVESGLVDAEALNRARAGLQVLLASSARTVEQVRGRVLEIRGGG